MNVIKKLLVGIGLVSTVSGGLYLVTRSPISATIYCIIIGLILSYIIGDVALFIIKEELKAKK